MARPRGSGINVVWKKRKDGSRYAIYYERSSGRRLGNTLAEAQAELEKLASEAEEAKPPPTPTFPDLSFGWLAQRYLETSEFASRKPATKALYRGYLKWMVETWGLIPIKGIKAADIERIKLLLRETPSKANQTLALFRLLLGYAERMEWVRRNVATRPGRLPPPKRHQVWDDTDINRFLDAADPRLRLGMGLMLHTAQRLGDVLAMRAGQVTERNGRLWIGLKQAKTDALVNVPVHARLEPLVRERLAEIKTLAVLPVEKAGNGKPHIKNDLLIPSPEGRLWQKRNFSRVWDEAVTRANDHLARQLAESGMTDRQIEDELEARHRERRDLRRTGIVRMAEAGATTPQIAAVIPVSHEGDSKGLTDASRF